jgi:hypothetical protein
MLLAQVDGHKVMARLCEEVVDDHGFERCNALAGQRILAAVKSRNVPDEVVVKTTDFLLS